MPVHKKGGKAKQARFERLVKELKKEEFKGASPYKIANAKLYGKKKR
jgi:hypothetical protein